MTAVLSLTRQSSEIDDSSDGGFQFAHPLFAATATPLRTERVLPQTASAHTNYSTFKTPSAHPTYTRFGRRQPLGTRTLSSDGQNVETPAQTLYHSTSKASASVARWKRTGRIGLGPPKRAERQSLDPEEELLANEHEENEKENEPPTSQTKASKRSSSRVNTSDSHLANYRSSTSPASINRSVLSEHSSQSIRSQHECNTQQTTSVTSNREPLSELAISQYVATDHAYVTLPRNVLVPTASSVDAPINYDPPFKKIHETVSTHKSPPRLAPISSENVRSASEPISIVPALNNGVPVAVSEPSHTARPSNNSSNPVVFADQAPPPKMSLDGPTPTAARKAKTLGRIVMNGREYTRLDQIGKGGSSKVFRVMAPNGRIFALKRVDFEQADQSTILGYKSEIDLLNRMSSSSGSERIIKLYDSEVNDTKGRLLMLMEAGEIDLAHMLTKRQAEPADFNFIRLFWRHMLEAVQAVHDQKIVHSDLKPANFLLVEGSLKLIDFGIAKAIGNDTTNIHRDQQVGTINYMSPEALSDTGGNAGRLMKLGRASDVWSLGCILYQMVYGRTPFSHLTMIQKIQAIPNEAHRIDFPVKAYPPSALNDKVKDETTARIVDGDLLRVMRGCLERDQRQRLTIERLLQDPFLRPEEKLHRAPQADSVPITVAQITELLRLTVSQTREKTLRKETIHNADIEYLAKDFFDRLRWAQ
ncbi:Serine/threonine-protein kinase mph1 [Taphrina deformans PYCC 5710]|uniref:Serine/threonine-protein kinase mph1 n=1 Tax=Taphrina deformans (strain PYCC 5710 / ATCC 11124 / CBS 356.35 / IMI 108563 / JCM 9778 / NBRC 8474) TaxID=1097556 RepID=R4XE99_TAPDE|nr:Serine/threonine-protein kinase mph1 [Taphrina deformans PYCC 5710]|eukprot:CCG81687.1 Serine/threonine-protein kinase mph1 [Taphrina deformans PYCC 5710]